MGRKDIVVVGASMGGIEALQEVVRNLPKDFTSSVFVVMHTAPTGPGVLDRILTRAGLLPASIARDGDSIQPGHIYVAPADYHLTLESPGRMRLSRGPKENRFRPAIDPLFRSAAHAFGTRVVGVILTGFLDDGTAGLWTIKERGGTAIVQHPEEAVASSMPMSALKHVEVNYCVRLSELGPLLVDLSQQSSDSQPSKPRTFMANHLEAEVKIAREGRALQAGVTEWGEPSLYSCPECHGVLMKLKEGLHQRFRCHTGHAYSIESLLSEFDVQTEESIWCAVRSLEETMLLIRSIAAEAEQHQHNESTNALVLKAQEAADKANVLRKILLQPVAGIARSREQYRSRQDDALTGQKTS